MKRFESSLYLWTSSKLQFQFQVTMLSCQTEVDLVKDSGRLHKTSKLWCGDLGRICSAKSSAVYLLCFLNDIVGISVIVLCERGPGLKNCILYVMVHESFVLFWIHSNNTLEYIECPLKEECVFNCITWIDRLFHCLKVDSRKELW